METRPNRFDLSGKVALVTGGSRGIGKYLASVLVEAGASVVIVSRHLEEGQKVAGEIRDAGGQALALYGDISQVNTLRTMVDEAVDVMARIDILVNNSGTNVRKPALDFDEAEWDRVLDTNLRGTFFCSQTVAKKMIPCGGTNGISC